MDIFVTVHNSQLVQIVNDESEVSSLLAEIHEEHVQAFGNQPEWNRRYYADATNFAAQQMIGYKVYRIEDGRIQRLPSNWMYELQYQRRQIPGITDVTDSIFRIENAQYEGALKLFATVVKQGIKSTGLEVIVDPQHSGAAIRPIEEYEALVGTFARIKATTDVTGYGWQVLFFAPESLGNYRIETQQINGRRMILL